MRFRLPELHLGDTERGARDIKNVIWCSYGHLIYQEKIIKCVWRGILTGEKMCLIGSLECIEAREDRCELGLQGGYLRLLGL